MKRKLIKNQQTPVVCSYCKTKNAYHTVHGIGYGGRTICSDCYSKEMLKADKEKDVSECSLGEEQLYKQFGVY